MKQAADGIPIRAVLLILAFGLSGCVGSSPSDSTVVPEPSPPAEALGQPVVAPPEIGLIPLPSVRQVQEEAPGGRVLYGEAVAVLLPQGARRTEFGETEHVRKKLHAVSTAV